MLAEMRDSPRLSRRSSVRKKTAPTRRTKFHRPNKPSHFLMRQQAPNEPAQQPTSSRHSQPPNVARRKRVSTICVTWSRTLRRAKTKKSAVLREHANKRTSSIGPQYRPKPHLRADKDFQTCLHQICSRAEQDSSDLWSVHWKKTLAQIWSPYGPRRLMDASHHISRQELTRTSRTEDPARHQQIQSQRPQAQTSSQTQAKCNWRTWWMNFQHYLMYFPKMKVKSCKLPSCLFYWLSKRSQTKNLKRSRMRKASKNQ